MSTQTSEIRNCVREISSSIREKELAIFCGAGISKNSGLPLANELKRYVLKKMPIAEKDMNDIIDSRLPFEAFMETVSAMADISIVLGLFKEGEPNANHILIAELAKHGYLRTVLTTNLDLLIEKALEKEGLKENTDFRRYYREEHFSEINFDVLSDKIAVFKIHGSADDKDSIRATLRAVASRTLYDKRASVIEYLFSSGGHKKVLILGYSCSDEFDITPAIQSLEKNEKEIILVQHCEKEEVEDIGTKDFRNPFKKFTGKSVRCNTDNFISDLWDSLGKIVGISTPVKSRVNWEMYVDDWAKCTKEEHRKYFTAALLLYEISDFKRAIEYYEKALGIAKEIGDKANEELYYRSLGVTYYALGDFKRALESHSKALEIAETIENRLEEEACNGNLGVTYFGMGDFKTAIYYFEKALGVAKEIGHKQGESKCYIGLGDAYCGLGRDSKGAIQYYKKALETAKDMGDKSDEAACYEGLGNAYSGMRDLENAIEYHRKSLEIWIAIGGKAEEGICCINLGVAFRGLRDFKKATEYLLTAKRIFKETRQTHWLRRVDVQLRLTHIHEKVSSIMNILKVIKNKKAT